MLGIVRVLTTEDESVLQEHSVIMDKEFGISSISRCIPDQPNGVYNEHTENLAIPKIEHLVKKLIKEDGVDAVTISCAADPAVESCRNLVSVPVIAAGEAGAHAALMVSRKIGVLGITPEIPENITRILGNHLVAYTSPKDVAKTTDLLKHEGKESAVKSVKSLIEQGVTCILFACTGFSTIGLKNELVKHIDVPVIDLVQAQAIAYKLIR